MRAAQFVRSYMDAWNHRDPQAVAEHLASDATYCDVPENINRSRDELVASLRGFFSNYRHRYELIGDIVTGENTIAFQYEMVPSARQLIGPYSDIYRGAEFIAMHDDEAVNIIDYYEVPRIGAKPGATSIGTREITRQKYAKSGLSEEQLGAYQNRLETVMRSEKVYLRSDLTLPRLAEAVDCSVNHLSQVINSGFGMSFFDYINQYRVAYAKELLAENGTQNTAILNIAFSVGFNSNSAFYTAFRKFAGQTPVQYRRTQLNRSR